MKPSPKTKSSVIGEPTTEEEVVTIYLIRHGETALNKEKKLRGWVDVPLNATGRRQALEVGKALSVVKLDRIYISDLTRAQETARAILAHQSDKVQEITTKDLRPLNFGEWNGELLSKVEPLMLKIQKKWETDPKLKAPKGESWESYQGRQTRLVDSLLSKAKPGEHIAVTAHLRNCVWWLAFVMNGGVPLEEEELELTSRITQTEGRVSVLSYSKKAGFKILATSVLDIAPSHIQINPKS